MGYAVCSQVVLLCASSPEQRLLLQLLAVWEDGWGLGAKAGHSVPCVLLALRMDPRPEESPSLPCGRKPMGIGGSEAGLLLKRRTRVGDDQRVSL